MKYARAAICLITFLCLASVGQAQAIFPPLTVEDLNGRTVQLPAQLPGEPTIVFIAFKQRQQPNIDAWAQRLGLQQVGGPAWVEMPVVGRGAALMRPIIDNGMRSGITSEAMRARTFTLYSSRNAFMGALGLSSLRQVYVALVNRDGSVRTIIAGDVTDAKVAQLRAAY